jgi:hypothetical protein
MEAAQALFGNSKPLTVGQDNFVILSFGLQVMLPNPTL